MGLHVSFARIFSGGAMEGGGREHPSLRRAGDHRGCYCADCLAGLAETALTSSEVTTTTTQPITLYQRYDIAVNLNAQNTAASPASMPMNTAVPPTRRNPNAT